MSSEKARVCILAMAMVMGLSVATQAAPYVFHEDFAAPPLTAGTEDYSFTDGWTNGDNGWEILYEGVPNTTDNTFGQRTGTLFTGGDTTFANIRSYSTGIDCYAIQALPSGQNFTSGNVTLKQQNMLASLEGWGGSAQQIWIMGKRANGDVAYAGIIAFGGIVGQDKMYAYETWGGQTIADNSTKTTDGKDLMWNGSFSPTSGNYGTLSIDFSLSEIRVTLSTTDAAGTTSSIVPVSFSPYSPVVEFTKVYLVLRAPTTTNSLVYMSEFDITAVPEAVIFHEDFAVPPLTAGTEINSWTDGWDNGDHGWEITEGQPNATDNTFGQRTGSYFTGGDTTVGTLRGYPGKTASAAQTLPTNQTFTDMKVTLNVQNMIASWGSAQQIWIMGELADGSVAYAGIIDFGGNGIDDKILVSTGGYKGGLTICDNNTTTLEGRPLQWNTAGFNPNVGNYARISIDCTLSAITVNVSTIGDNISSIVPVSFTPYEPVVKFTKVYVNMNSAPPPSGGLVYMSDFKITSSSGTPAPPPPAKYIPEATLTIDGNLSDWPAASLWSAPFVLWNGTGLSSTTMAKFAWNDAADLLYVAVSTNEATLQPGGHLVIGPSIDKTTTPTTGIGSTQLCFDPIAGGNEVLIQNEIQYYVDNYNLPWSGGGTGGVQAKYAYDSGTSSYTYEIAIPLWTNWIQMTTQHPLSAGNMTYVYVVLEDAIETDNGMDLSYLFTPGNPANFYMGASATNGNAWNRAAAFTLRGSITEADLTIVLAAMDSVTDDPNWNALADLDGDGEVTSMDLAIVLVDMP